MRQSLILLSPILCLFVGACVTSGMTTSRGGEFGAATEAVDWSKDDAAGSRARDDYPGPGLRGGGGGG